MAWARARESRSVCICNVHSVVTATQDAAFRTVIQEADMATPDGAPVAWTLRRKGFSAQERINGPDLMWRLCEQAAREGVPIGLYGATQPVLDLLCDILRKAFPGLDIAYCVSCLGSEPIPMDCMTLPTTGPTSAGMVSHESACTSSLFGTVRSNTRRPTGTIIAPPMPCKNRVATSMPSEPLAAQPIEPSRNTAIADMNVVRAPKRSATQPLTGMNTASDSR